MSVPSAVWNDDNVSNEPLVRFNVSLKEFRNVLVPKSKVKLTISTTSGVTVKSSVILEIPLVLMRKVESKTKNAKQKYNLVEGWPILCNIYPRKSPEKVILNEPAYVSSDKSRIGFVPPRMSAFLVADWTNWPRQSLPDHIAANLRYIQGNKYLPFASTVQMGIKRNELIQLNATEANNQNLPELHVEVAPIKLSRWAFYALMDESFSMHRRLGLMEESDMDDIRHLLTENSAELLGLTMIISVFHLLFDALAFKSEISFWRGINSAEGLSIRSTGLNLLSQVIVALYLKEQEASALVLLPCYFGLFVGGWKFLKLVGLRKSSKSTANGGMTEFAGGNSALEAQIDEADSTALKYMFAILLPLVVAYSILTLVRDDHTSWYSWGISSLASSVYAGGFALMTPQVVLNYRLKSVAHLDWSALWYRAFNTFIDDFFAYLIPMPGLARMAVLRDDLIFLIFLYQRSIYPARTISKEKIE